MLAIILRTGSKKKSVISLARDIINSTRNLAGLIDKNISFFKKFDGIGNDKASTISAVFEISRRIQMQSKWFSEKVIKSPEDIAEIFIPILRDEVKEKFIVVCLNSANKIINYEVITVGILNSSLIHPREIFKVAIENNSANIIIIHNHPSHNPEASNEDIKVTRLINEAAKIMDIRLFDHIIIGGDNFFSFSAEKLL